MDWKCGSNIRTPAFQVQNPEFKLQTQRRKEGDRETEREKERKGGGKEEGMLNTLHQEEPRRKNSAN
jgi:hypothetical protein